jgi:hypothetical protein
MNRCHTLLAGIGLVLAITVVAAESNPPIADVHVHYNWSQAEIISPGEVVKRLDANNIEFTVVSSSPPELALDLAAAGKGRVIPLFQPYLDAEGRYFWFHDKRVLPLARAGLASGQYKGIGELHLIAGIGPNRDNLVLNGLIQLAEQYDVPVLVHTETSDHRFFLPLCLKYPAVRFQWAHAGGLLGPDQVGALLAACENVWVDFSARDPMKYIRSQIVDKDGYLLPGWLALIKRYPDRFMIGSDPVWPIENRNPWDEADTGWDRLDELIQFHQHWLAKLPPDLAQKLRVENARRFYHYALKPSK